MSTNSVTERLDAYFKAKQITRSEIARRIGLNQPTFNNYFLSSENRRELPLSVLCSLAEMFVDLDLNELLRGTPMKTADKAAQQESSHGGQSTSGLRLANMQLREENKRLYDEIVRIRGLNDSLTETLIKHVKSSIDK